ncbi:CoA transferase [Gordonia humi]|uniref:CoA transferase n=1 Tax=Gordonia humi TaxID=686429 RepID=A0A840ETG8_9ACTN|nr:CoA transferase [Gordonia humi]MBB4133648.1 hypothetical protein [Gordonia humi]
MSDVAQQWAASGLAYLTGDPNGPPDFSRARILTHAASLAEPLGHDAAALLAGRASMMRVRRRGTVSAGEGSRLMRARDGWVTATLSREVDHDSIPAIVESDCAAEDPWQALAAFAARSSAESFVERVQLLGVPGARLGAVSPAVPRVTELWPRAERRLGADLLVVDLSSMWAGPLCGMILGGLGATVVKVESPRRPDGTRRGVPAFFTWMNGGKHVYNADPREDTSAVARLIDAADVVIEASRPRALAQVGLDADRRPPRAGRVWVRITGYGPDHPDRVAFGDDAAIAGGLVGVGAHGPVFCGDAIADPLTGITAAHHVVESLGRGGGEVIDVAMAQVAATYAALPTTGAPNPMPPILTPAPPTVSVSAPPTAATVEALVRSRSSAPC